MLRIEALSKSFGGRTLFDGVSMHVHPDDRVGLVGRNGEGKTTLLRIVAGLDSYDDGRVSVRNGARVGYLRQEVDPTSDRTPIDEVRTVFEPLRALEARMRELEGQMAAAGSDVPEALASQYDELRHAFERQGGFETEMTMQRMLLGLGIDEQKQLKPLSAQSGGWLMRVELAKLLLAKPELLLLDEPTNHLDLPSIRWFEEVLSSYPGAVIVVSHDRTLLDRHTTRIVELEHGRLTTYAGNYSAYTRSKAERRAEAEARIRNLDRQIAHAAKFVERFGAKASKAAQANSRKKLIERLKAERAELIPEQARRGIKFRFKPVTRSGELVLRLEGVSKSYGDLLVHRALDLEIQRGDRIALVGPNGAGKSTLLRIVAGALDIDAGAREVGHNVEIGFYAQHQLQALTGSRSVLQEIEADAALDEIPRLRNLLGTFLFSGDDVEKRVSVLSGGEKARLALARLLLGGANLLVMDEPTNHLDIQGREVVTDALSRFDGTLLFISHDRTLINALANRVLEVMPGPGGARTELLMGDFDDYERRLGESEAQTTPKKSGGKKKPVSPERQAERERQRALRKARQQLEETESAIEAAETRWEELDSLSADPEVVRDGERMREITHERRGLEQELSELNQRWEELADELTTLEAAAPVVS